MTQVVDNATADTINRNATSTGPTEPAGESHEPPVESEPPRHESGTASQVRTLPSEDASGGEVQGVVASHEGATGDELEGGGTDDEERRTSTSTDETAVTTAAHAYRRQAHQTNSARRSRGARRSIDDRQRADRRVTLEGQEGRGR